MLKFKKWITNVHRVRGDVITRHGRLRLDKNERLTPFAPTFWSSLKESLDWEAITAYPETEQLYCILAERLGVAISQLMLTAGSDGALRHAFDVCVNEGDEVIVIEPTFAMVDVYCGLFGATRKAAGYDSSLNLDMVSLIGSIGSKTSLIIIANPNSPTGTLVAEPALVTILEKAMEYGVPVLIDEAYHGFCQYTALPLLERFPNLVVSRTFSKASGLAGLRVGYLVASSELAQLFYKFRPMYEVNSLGVLCAMQMLKHPEVVDDYLRATQAGRRKLFEALKHRGIPYVDTYTNFVHVNFGEAKDSVKQTFTKEGILFRESLAIPEFESCLRLSLGPVEPVNALIEAIDCALNHQWQPTSEFDRTL